MADTSDPWQSNPLHLVALMAPDQAPVILPPTDSIVWTLMRQNQLMQDENRSLRTKVQTLQEENVWASSEIDRMHWENQAARVEMQWLWGRMQPPLEIKTYAQTLRSCENKTTYAQTLQPEETIAAKHEAGGERCLRHEPIMRREKRQCKCCVLEAIHGLMMSAPQITPDLGEYVASNLVNIPPFANFWCPGCTREFVNGATWHELERILYLIRCVEHEGATMAELKRCLKNAALRQRVKCAVHLKA